MLKNSILPTKVNIRKLIKKIIILNIITYICIGILLPNKILAAQIKKPYSEGSLQNYPGYEQLIKNLQAKHPTWTFTILDTGLDWNEVIKNETYASHGRSLIYYTYSGGWVCSICKDKLYDSGKWKCASETAVSYYMDPRNWLNENNIFQFENLSYNEQVHNIEGVQKILNSVKWAKDENITYTKPDGTTAIIEKSYAEIIMEAGKANNVSPYHLASRLVQEQGVSLSSTASGKYTGYTGYYNFFNIQASSSNSSSAQVIINGLNYAKTKGWDNPEKSINGGAAFIAQDYIKRGQSTLYLQKFDVDNSDGSMYYHQYMQNVSAIVSEGSKVKTSYESIGCLDSNFNFLIPVYKNMPKEISPSPDGMYLVTQNVKVKGNNVIIRDGKSTSATEIAKVNTGDVLLRIEVTGTKEDGYYWDKVVLSDGKQGYVAREFIEQITDVTNANISAVINANDVYLRNGPGKTGTKLVTKFTSGQSVTIIEIGKYNSLDNYDWYRVKLNNGTQGYVASNFLTEVSSTNYIIAYINCNENGNVNIRSGIGTNNSVVTSLKKDVKVTVLEKSAGTANGYTWDKIVTEDGLQGFIANIYLRYPNNNFKIDGSYIVAEPETKVSDIKDRFASASVKANGAELGNDKLIGTGNVVSVDGKSYTVVKLGDLSGDGLIKSADYILLKNYISGKRQLTEYEKKAADINKDSNIKSADYILVKNYISGKYKLFI